MTSSFNNYEFSIATLANDHVFVNVTWCTGALSLETLDPLTQGEWQHVSVIFRKLEGILILVNGRVIRSSLEVLPDTDPNLVAFTWPRDTPLINGANLTLWDDVGLVDELRFWSVALSNSRARTAHCRRLPGGSTSNLVALWNFDSNLAKNGTRIDLNVTYDLAGGAKHIVYTSPLPAAYLVKEETNGFCGPKQNTLSLILLGTIGGVIGILLLIWVGVVIYYLVQAGKGQTKKSSTRTRGVLLK